MANTIKAVVTNTTPAELVFYYDEVDHSSEGTVLEVSSTGYTSPESASWCAYTFTSVRFDNSCQNWEPTSLRYFFGYSTANTTITSIDCTNLNTSNVTDMRYTFSSCSGLTSIDVSGFNTSKVTSMEALFYKCSSLTSIDISNFDTSNVINMPSMFRSCSELTELDLSNFSTMSLSNISVMFSDDTKLEKIYINKDFNVSNVTNGTNTFRNCLSLPRFSSSNVDSTMAKAVNYGGYLYIKPKERHFFYNTNDPLNITYNTNVVRKVKYNNTEVWNRTRLPQEYQEVEYIESSGTQYIDTGVTGTQNTKVDIDFQSTATTYGSFLPFGARSGASNDCFAIWASSGTIGSNLRIGFDSSSGYNGGPTTTDKYHIIHSKDGTYVNNELVWTTETFSTFTTPQNLLVFGYYNNPTTMGLSAIRLYHLKLWENNVLIQDLVPCYRKSDGEIGLYDLVTDTFLTNSGTGTFLKGQSINYILPDTYQEVQYIESSGTQFIDTGIIPNDETGVKLEVSLPNVTTDTFIFGCRQDDSNTRFVIGKQNGACYFGFGSITGAGASIWGITQDIPFTAYLNYYDNRKAYINSAAERNLNSISHITFTYSLILFGRNRLGNIGGVAQKIYECKITENNDLIADYVPCYRKSDNEAGLYDIVTNTFLTNQGTGEFNVGEDVN